MSKYKTKEEWLWLIAKTKYFEVWWLEYAWDLGNGFIEPNTS